MEGKTSRWGASFGKALRSFQTGGFNYDDLLDHASRQLTAGASRSELLEVLRRRQSVEPLPDDVHEAVVRLLQGVEAVSNAADAATEPAALVARPEDTAAPRSLATAAPGGSATAVAATAVLPGNGPPPAAAQTPTDPIPPPGDTAAKTAPASISGVLTTPQFPRHGKRPSIWFTAAAIAVVAGLVVDCLALRKPQPSAPSPMAQPAAPSAPPAVPPAGTVLHDCPICPQMTVLPKGRFKQGARYDDRDAAAVEKPQHVVVVRTPFAMSTNEITVREFENFVAATGRAAEGCTTFDGEWHYRPKAGWKEPNFSQIDASPVTCVSWNDAVAYAEWLSGTSGHRYRLPSAAEWEYAARAGSEAARPWNSSADACSAANVADRSAAHRYRRLRAFSCDDGHVNTAPVGSFKSNAFGLNDMPGNVSQWTEDCWHESYAKAPIDTAPRPGGDCTERELRGISWASPPADARTSYRGHFPADYRSSAVGFRLVRELH